MERKCYYQFVLSYLLAGASNSGRQITQLEGTSSLFGACPKLKS